jgi:GMP synthase (glutamine-hydrolysing)
VLRNFLAACGATGDWSMKSFIDTEVAAIRTTVGADRVLCALSGGVDSSVVAVLLHKAIGDQLTCLFVDNGLLRNGEAEAVVSTFWDAFKTNLIHVDASKRFLDRLAYVTDPETKRKRIGNEFIAVFWASWMAWGD